MNLTLTADIASVTPAGSTVTSVENVNLQSNGSVTADTSSYTGTTSLTATAADEVVLTAASTTDVVASTSDAAADNSTIDGGNDVTFSVLGGAGGTVKIGGTTAPAGDIVYTANYKAADGSTHGIVNVTGGTSQSVTMTTTNAVNTDNTFGKVTATGGASTTSVTVAQDAAQTKSGTKNGIINGDVDVLDANRASTTKAGSITDVTIHSGADVVVNSSALETLSLKGKFTTVNAGTLGALTKAAISSLQVNTNGVTTSGAVTIDADIKTLNIDNSTASSSFNSLSASGATAVNITGDKTLTVTAHTFAASTVIDASAASNGAKFSGAILAGQTYKGGDGVDTITLSNAFTKANTTGAGNDVITYGGAAGSKGSLDAGDGDDTIIMTTAQAKSADDDATFNSTFTNFEKIKISDATSGTTNMAGLSNVTMIELAAGGDNATTAIIENIASGATVTQSGNGTGVVLNVRDAAFSATDSLNLVLSKSGILAAGTLTTAGIETITISTADAVATGSTAAIHTATLKATSATSVTVTGNNGLNLTNTGNTKITTFDASGVVANGTADTAANLAVSFASANTTATASVTIKGGDGNDTLSGSVAKDTIHGNGGADDIYTDNAGTKRVETFTVAIDADGPGNTAAGETVTASILGFDSSFALVAGSLTAAAGATGLAAAINANADLAGLVSASAAGAVVTVTYAVDGNTVGSASNSDASTTLTAAQVTAGAVGTAAVDSVDGGAGADLIAGGGGADSLTGGAGIDTFFFLKAQSNLATRTVISDYTYTVGGTENDKIVIGDITTAAGTVATVQDLSSSQSLAAALDAAATNNTVNNGLSVFIHGGNTYAFVETTGATATYQAADFVVEITGTPIAASTAIAGLGVDGI